MATHTSGHSDRKYDRDFLLSAQKRNHLIELWEVEKYGRDCFNDPDHVHLYGIAPPAAKATPDWLPINAYPGNRKADRADHGIKLAAAALSAAMPTIFGGDDRSWRLGCGCGLF